MFFATKIFVINLLKQLRSCQSTGYLIRSQLAPLLKISVKKQLSKLVINFFTESLATKANLILDKIKAIELKI